MPMPPHAEAGAHGLSVIALPGADAMADRLAGALGASRTGLLSRRFPDRRELPARARCGRGPRAAVAAALARPGPTAAVAVLPGRYLARAWREPVGLVAPYLPYMRQDARFHDGEAVTSRSVAAWVDALLSTASSPSIRTCTGSRPWAISTACRAWWHRAPARSRRGWRAHVRGRTSFGPDAESEQWAAEVAQGAGCAYSMLKKTRLGDREVQIVLPPLEPARGCMPVLVDDIISSAQTMAVAVSALRAAGFADSVCIGVHAVFGDAAEQRLTQAGAGRVVSCNTLPHASNAIDVTPALADAVTALRRAWADGPARGTEPRSAS
jgi:ribose-phosphate pyrophosphokinase